MNIDQQKAHLTAFQEKMSSVMMSKGDDYADSDRLSNFKKAGAICGLTAEQNCLSLIATKVARLGVLLQGVSPSNESVRDSVLDLANYAVLLDMILSEPAVEKVEYFYAGTTTTGIMNNKGEWVNEVKV